MTLQMELVTIPAFFVFVKLDHLQYAGERWKESFNLRCHDYLIPPYVSLKYAVSFAYWAFFQCILVLPIQLVMIFKVMMVWLQK